MQSNVEKKALEDSPYKLRYEPSERLGAIVVPHFPALGSLTALRFLEWVQTNPEGVVSLPTGKTPEYFVKEVTRILAGWNRPEVLKEVGDRGLDTGRKPQMRGLRFVQIDEFYPINPRHHNSFYFYVNRFYLEGFGIDAERALLIDGEAIGIPSGQTLDDVWGDDAVDITLRYRHAVNARERTQQHVIRAVDDWCVKYEQQIRDRGGIGFFLGGIGPDGHIGFNVRGSDMFSTTRLTPVNYETQAAAATDLGGIETARKRLVVTIGLSTITYNPDCTAIIIAAGAAKAHVVADAIQHTRNVSDPATSLQQLKDARFYLTQGAASELRERRRVQFEAKPSLSDEDQVRIIVDLALEKQKKIVELTDDDYRSNPFSGLLLEKAGSTPDARGKSSADVTVARINAFVESTLKARIDAGMTIRSGKRFLHTEPHHDDIMLGYLPFVVRHIRDHSTSHNFVTLTSGFTSVTNRYMLALCSKLSAALKDDRYEFRRLQEEGYFDPDNPQFRNYDVWKYLDGIASESASMCDEGSLRRLLRDLIVVFEESDLDNIGNRVDELINYFETQYPGKKDLPYIQQLKGMTREWESSCLWGYFGWDASAIHHLRLGFYKGEIFTEDPTFARDVIPVVNLLKATKPNVVTVAFDPEASGPDTHYKVLQAVSGALKQYEEETADQEEGEADDIEVIGYRNIWFRFHPSEANIFVPVSLNMLTLQHSSFMNTYLSQRDASFPSYEMDGPFSKLAQKIQVEQYEALQTCLGREFFYEHPSALIRATRGFVFLQSMNLAEFYEESLALKRLTESEHNPMAGRPSIATIGRPLADDEEEA
ncbi:MAG TPA: glucosamine-6-phosphate deaminase [Spirochaetia bacterium]|nr:glucosamine-6-phosphate deaminase [Spirochaetia bacterium]